MGGWSCRRIPSARYWPDRSLADDVGILWDRPGGYQIHHDPSEDTGEDECSEAIRHAKTETDQKATHDKSRHTAEPANSYRPTYSGIMNGGRVHPGLISPARHQQWKGRKK